jgi:hypothetical protein
MHIKYRYLVLALIPVLLPAQNKTDLQQILERMDRLEQENRNLAAEVRALRDELAVSHPALLSASPSASPSTSASASPSASAPASPAVGTPAEQPADAENATAAPAAPLEERVAVQERKVDDLAQTKVQTSQRLPVTLSGMVLFNAFMNGNGYGGQQDPVLASSSTNGSGASLSQSIVGLAFQGPHIFGGGQVTGDIHFDLAGGTTSSLNHLIRLRVANIRMDWKSRSLIVGQDKPIISPRDPSSLAQVAFSPLTDAGNPWLWQPQARFEQRFTWGEDTGLRAQAGVYETSEPTASAGPEYAATLAAARPALEGRFLFWRNLGHGARIEIAPGFHTSQSHVAGVSVPSRLFSVDWMIQPVAKLQWTGMFFTGQNAAGIGALRQGFTIFSDGIVQAVATSGGWTQLSYLLSPRLTFNIYGGQESNPAADLLAGEITRNFAYAGNVVYRLGTNVLLGLEASQVRTNYLGLITRLNNHYDLALAYLF